MIAEAQAQAEGGQEFLPLDSANPLQSLNTMQSLKGE